MAKQRKQTKQKKFIPSPKIKEIAGELDAEYKKHIQLTVLKEGAVGYKDIIVKQNKNDNWALYSIYNTKDMISEFKLKTCAVMAAKAYSTVSLNRFTEIKDQARPSLTSRQAPSPAFSAVCPRRFGMPRAGAGLRWILVPIRRPPRRFGLALRLGRRSAICSLRWCHPILQPRGYTAPLPKPATAETA